MKKNIYFKWLGFIVGSIVIIIGFNAISFKESVPNSYKTYLISHSKINQGEALSFENTSVARFDIGQSESHFILSDEFENYEGLFAQETILENQPLKKSFFDKELSSNHKIPNGKRLYILDVPVGPIVSILKSKDTIDVIAHIDMPGLQKMTETILEGVQLVETEHLSNEPIENIKYLSFYLSPDEVKILSFIKPYSDFSVVLRNPNDKSNSKVNPMTFNEFVQNEKIQLILHSGSFRIINGKPLKSISTAGTIK